MERTADAVPLPHFAEQLEVRFHGVTTQSILVAKRYADPLVLAAPFAHVVVPVAMITACPVSAKWKRAPNRVPTVPLYQ
jgi:hypothetical protein